MEIVGKDTEFVRLIWNNVANHEVKVTEAVKKKEKGWERKDNIVYWKGRICVPKHKVLRQDIIRHHHDSTVTGHPGRYKTAELVLRNYWWPRIQDDIWKYVEGCDLCQRTKTFP